MRLFGLTGIEGDVDGKIFRRPSQASRLLRQHKAITAASDNGSVTAWREDSGIHYRAEFHQYGIRKAWWRGKQKTRLTRWLEIWMPRMEKD